MVYSSNSYLNLTLKTVNAKYIMGKFLSYGWTKESIAGMLGNMDTESTINPGLWESLNEGNMERGYGLTQWTPASKVIIWLSNNNYPIDSMDGQIARIIYELNNGGQYYPTTQYPLTFLDFTQSTESPEYLASAFLKNYERAGEEKESERRANARYWFDNIDGESAGGGKPAFPTWEGAPVTSPYGWRIHPIEQVLKFHAGTDFGSNGGNPPIYATQSGVVVSNVFTSWGGNMITIRHTGDPYYSRYLHLAHRSPILAGKEVVKGQEIGLMGTTGDSTGIHLHFEVALTSDGLGTENSIDPEVYLQMDFGDGDGDGGLPPSVQKTQDYLALLLCDAVNGWKF